jgi:hypothetical protein
MSAFERKADIDDPTLNVCKLPKADVVLPSVGSSARSIVEHGQCSPAFSGLQSKKQRARILDVSLRPTLRGRLQGHGSRMIWAAHENQSLRQAPHGCAVDSSFLPFEVSLSVTFLVRGP